MIVVTGASKGIGKAICERLHNNGLSVLGIARNIEKLEFPTYKCDVSSYEQIKNLSNFLRLKNIEVNGLINSAGIASMNLAVTTPKSIVEKLIATNLVGTIYCCQILSPLMIRIKKGTIINFSTIAVSLGLKGESIYVASKAGVEGFTRSFAREMADFNISVNCIAPGPINTDLLKGISNEQINKIVSQQVIQKRFTTDSIVDLVEVMLDKRSSSISGQTFHVGGV